MAAPHVRANYEQLEQIATQFKRASDNAKQQLRAVKGQVEVLRAGDWIGRGADKFYEEMDTSVLPSSTRLATALDEAARVTREINRLIQQAEAEAARILDKEPGDDGVDLPKGLAIPAGMFADASPGSPALGFASGNGSANNLNAAGNSQAPMPTSKAEWQRAALIAAGVDPATWDPKNPFLGPNAENTRKLYEYYGKLYLEHPELQWAGLAKLAGSTVYAGLAELAAAKVALLAGTPVAGPLGLLGANELDFLEHKMLEMRNAIFDDIGWQHTAYAQGGIQTMRDLHARGELTRRELDVWEDTASGDPARIARASRNLADMEQNTVLQPHYNDIQSRGPFGISGAALTTALSWAAESPVPGGKRFGDVVTREVWGIDTGIPGNLANREDRWKWITDDMLPKWNELAQGNPQRAREILSLPVEVLAARTVAKQGESVLRGVSGVLPPYIKLPPLVDPVLFPTK